MWLGKNHVRIQLLSDATVQNWLTSGRTSFGIDASHRVAALCFYNLTAGEMLLLNYGVPPRPRSIISGMRYNSAATTEK